MKETQNSSPLNRNLLIAQEDQIQGQDLDIDLLIAQEDQIQGQESNKLLEKEFDKKQKLQQQKQKKQDKKFFDATKDKTDISTSLKTRYKDGDESSKEYIDQNLKDIKKIEHFEEFKNYIKGHINKKFQQKSTIETQIENFENNEFKKLKQALKEQEKDNKGIQEKFKECFQRFEEIIENLKQKAVIEKFKNQSSEDLKEQLKKQEENNNKDKEKREKYKICFQRFEEIIQYLPQIHDSGIRENALKEIATLFEIDPKQLEKQIEFFQPKEKKLDKPQAKAISSIISKPGNDLVFSPDDQKEVRKKCKEIERSTLENQGVAKDLVEKYIALIGKYNGGNYKSKTAKDIRERSNEIKAGNSVYNGEINNEILALIIRANQIVTGNLLRDVQILSLLAFLDGGTNKFCQIDTGEGKTTITSALAVLQILTKKDEVVDIITSNPVLAEGAVKDRQDFYALFGITVTHNNPDLENPYIEGPKQCQDKKTNKFEDVYAHDVVYGTIGAFAFDHLNNNVEGLNTKALHIQNDLPVKIRACDTVIVDEADNVILDNYALWINQAQPVAGVEQVKFIYIEIWMALIQAENRIFPVDSNFDIANVSDENKQKLKEQISINKLETKLDEDIRLLAFIKELVKGNLESLIDNAINARYDLHVNEDYVIDSKDGEDNILPLEKEIGVRLQNFIWTDLHPFVQMKHNLHVNSCGSLTSIFIPNCEYIKLYKKIYGLTGTLGSDKERKLIFNIYEAFSLVIPPFIENKRKDQGLEIAEGEEAWLEKIVAVASKHMNRAVLFVCDTPKALRKIEQKLRINLINRKIIIYENEGDAKNIDELNEGDQKNINEPKKGAKPGTIIIATNIGGRGTDIKISKQVENSGGLHECTTYLPKNKRTERQAAGRAARSGEPGSTQIIVQQSEIQSLKKVIEASDIEEKEKLREVTDPKKLRDIIEERRLAGAEKHLRGIGEQYKQFKEFGNIYYNLKKAKKINYFILSDLKLRFGLVYNSGRCEEFLKNIKSTTCFANYEFFNPHYAVKYAQNLLLAGEIEEARSVLKPEVTVSESFLKTAQTDLTTFRVARQLGDGNCFYRAVADQLKRLEFHESKAHNYQFIKTQALEYIKNNKEASANLLENLEGLRGDIDKAFMGRTIKSYIEYNESDGAWADTHTIEATAKSLKINIRIYGCTQVEFNPGNETIVNLRYTGNHYDSLFIPGEHNQEDKEYDALPAYHLTMFEIELANSSNIFKRILDATGISGLIDPFISVPEDQSQKRIKIDLNKAEEKLKQYAEEIKTLINSGEFKAICFNKEEQKYNQGDNMMLKHLESEQNLITATILHVQNLMKQISHKGQKFVLRKTYNFKEVIENDLEVNLATGGILVPETTIAESVGLGLYYEVAKSEDIEDDKAVGAREEILVGSLMLASAYIPVVGFILAPATALPASSFIRRGIKKLLSLILNEPDIYNENEELDPLDVAGDILFALGGPVTAVPKILRTVFQEVCTSLMANYFIKNAGAALSEMKNKLIQPIKDVIKVPLEAISKAISDLIDQLKDWIIEPVRELLNKILQYAQQNWQQVMDLFNQNKTAEQNDISDRITVVKTLIQTTKDEIFNLQSEVMGVGHNSLAIFQDFKKQTAFIKKFKDLKAGKTKALRALLDIIKNLVGGEFIRSIQNIIEKIKKVVKQVTDSLPQLIKSIITTLETLKDYHINYIIKDIQEKGVQFLWALINSLGPFLMDKIIKEGVKFFEKVIGVIISNIEAMVDLIIQNNPISKFLNKHGIDLSNPILMIEKACSYIIDLLIRFIKSKLFQPPKKEEKQNVGEANQANLAKQNQCVPFAIASLFGVKPNELGRVVRKCLSDQINSEKGLTKWQAKFVLEDFNLDVKEEHAKQKEHYEAKVRLIEHYKNNQGAVVLFAQNNGGHSYFINKEYKFIDKPKEDGVAVNDLPDYTEGWFLIPQNFSENEKKEIQDRIGAGTPIGGLSFKLIIRRIQEALFPSRRFGADESFEALKKFLVDIIPGNFSILDAQNAISLTLPTYIMWAEESASYLDYAAKQQDDCIINVIKAYIDNKKQKSPDCEYTEMYKIKEYSINNLDDLLKLILSVEKKLRDNKNKFTLSVQEEKNTKKKNTQDKISYLDCYLIINNPEFSVLLGRDLYTLAYKLKNTRNWITITEKEYIAGAFVQRTIQESFNFVIGSNETPQESNNSQGSALPIFDVLWLKKNDKERQKAIVNIFARVVCESIRNNTVFLGLIRAAQGKLGNFIPQGIAWNTQSLGMEGTLDHESAKDKNPFNVFKKAFLQGTKIKRRRGLDNIHPIFNEYTIEAMKDILKLRVQDIFMSTKSKASKSSLLSNSLVLGGDYIFGGSSDNDFVYMLGEVMSLKNETISVILAPFSLHGRHAVGMMFVKQEDSGQYQAFYLDPENTTIPEGLAAIFKESGYEIEQLPTERQRYTNCGPEVIENFMLYLTGERLSQEDAIIHNSRLVEEKLMAEGGRAEEDYSFNTYIRGSYFLHELSRHVIHHHVVNQAMIADITTLQANNIVAQENRDADEVEVNNDPNRSESRSFLAVNNNQELAGQDNDTGSLEYADTNKLYSKANELFEEGWLAEASDEEEAPQIAESRFLDAMQLYADAIMLDPTNIAYQQAFNIVSLKIDGNNLFNEGLELADLAYQLQEQLLFKTQTLKANELIISKYLEIMSFYQASYHKFAEGLTLSNDLRFASCMELVEQSVNMINETVDSLERLNLETLTDSTECDSQGLELFNKKLMIDTDGTSIELFTHDNEGDLIEINIMGTTDYYITI